MCHVGEHASNAGGREVLALDASFELGRAGAKSVSEAKYKSGAVMQAAYEYRHYRTAAYAARVSAIQLAGKVLCHRQSCQGSVRTARHERRAILSIVNAHPRQCD